MGKEEKYCPFSILPTEILYYIFTLMPAKHVVKCRQVCTRWKHIIDDLSNSDDLWQNYCKADFNGLSKTAHMKAYPRLIWFNVYRSLALWSQLVKAKEVCIEFAAASSLNKEIKHFVIMQNGIIGVHKKEEIVYYDIDSLEQLKVDAIPGDFLRYTENEDMIILLNNNFQLSIKQKPKNNSALSISVTFDNVITFALVENERKIYYLNLDNEIYVCHIEENFNSKFLYLPEEFVIALGYSNKSLIFMTYHRNIYSVIKEQFVFVKVLDTDHNLLHQLREYNFLNRMDFRVYLQWTYMLDHTIPDGPLSDVVTVHTYGDMVFVGSTWGLLSIYYVPIPSEEFNLLNAKPVKQYSFMDHNDKSKLTMCPIIKIDVMETYVGHDVFVAMPKKIVVLKLLHTF